MKPRYLFVTGKLAEPALRRLLEDLGPRVGFEWSVAVLPITVAALATTAWIGRHLPRPAGFDRVLLPGLCRGNLDELHRTWPEVPVERGPNDLVDLPEHFGRPSSRKEGYGTHDTVILAEINHAPRLEPAALVAEAQRLAADGADLIDLGCDPGGEWAGLGDAVRRLIDLGLRVSVDTFDPREAAAGARAGAEMVLSVDATNREQAPDWGCTVVAVPDAPSTLDGLDDTLAFLDGRRVPCLADPILEPIGFGFANSLGRYLEVRRRHPQVEMLMGIGNLTELTEVDAAGVNVLLVGFCREQRIRHVLTTQVANWCRSCVREIDLARRLVHFACSRGVLPKHLDPDLLLLRDPKVRDHGAATLAELAGKLTDRNFRLFAEGGELHVLNRDMHLRGTDPFDLFAEMLRREAIDPGHAFYLGYELSKAATALALGKNYVQDQALRWGFLTVPETSHRAAAGENPQNDEGNRADGERETP